MSAERQQINVKRVSCRKRSREDLTSHLTPARKRGSTCVQQCPKTCRLSSIMTDTQAEQFCSDSEDLFGDYDSILEDSSILAKLDDAEQNARQPDVRLSADQPDFTALWPANPSCEDVLTDSILDGLGDEPFEDLPPSQLQFHEQVQEHAKRSRLQGSDKTLTPFRDTEGNAEAGRSLEDKTTRPSKARRSVADQLKRTMVCNAAAPSNVSRSAILKKAVVSEEISVAMQAMETVSAETTDLGPFFGLPSKVKDLMYKLRGIKTLYGDAPFTSSLREDLMSRLVPLECLFSYYEATAISGFLCFQSLC